MDISGNDLYSSIKLILEYEINYVKKNTPYVLL